jgi:hypothetical protein
MSRLRRIQVATHDAAPGWLRRIGFEKNPARLIASPGVWKRPAESLFSASRSIADDEWKKDEYTLEEPICRWRARR